MTVEELFEQLKTESEENGATDNFKKLWDKFTAEVQVVVNASEELSEEEIEKLNKLIKEAVKLNSELSKEKDEDEEDEDEEVEDDELQDEEVEAETKEDSNNEFNNKKEGVTFSMAKEENVIIEDVGVNSNKKQMELFRKYLKEGVKFEDLKSDSDGVVIPEYEELEFKNDDVFDIAKHVTVKPVTTRTGRVARTSFANADALPSVAELVESDKIGGLEIQFDEFEVETHRGYITHSQELLQDVPEFDSLIADYVEKLKIKTRTQKVLDALEDTKRVEVEDILTDVPVVDEHDVVDAIDFRLLPLDAKYRKAVYLSRSAYNKIARWKDSEGRYVLQNDFTKPDALTILGLPVYIFDDEEIGVDTVYFGDLKQAVTVFQRHETVLQWVDHLKYGRCISPVIRLDAKVVNSDALIKVNILDAEEVGTGEDEED